MLNFTYNHNTGTLTVCLDAEVHTITKEHENYKLLLEAFKAGDEVKFNNLLTSQGVEVLAEDEYLEDGMEIRDGKLYYNNVEVQHVYAKKIVAGYTQGFPVTPMLNFLKNLMQNPSSRSVAELPDFLENRNLAITEDGCFLCYKSVQSSWYSKASGSLKLLKGKVDSAGRIYNAVGESIECARNEVDDERGNECSHGLHVGGLEYSGPNGWYNSPSDKIVICKVNPKDVVSVPKDHNAQKVRICAYEVVAEYKRPLNDFEGVKCQQKDVDLDNLQQYDSLTFGYKGVDDPTVLTRHALVTEVLSDCFVGLLLPQDLNYEYGSEIRNFKFDRMSNVEYFNSDEDEDDDFWDEDEEDTDYGW